MRPCRLPPSALGGKNLLQISQCLPGYARLGFDPHRRALGTVKHPAWSLRQPSLFDGFLKDTPVRRR